MRQKTEQKKEINPTIVSIFKFKKMHYSYEYGTE